MVIILIFQACNFVFNILGAWRDNLRYLQLSNGLWPLRDCSYLSSLLSQTLIYILAKISIEFC
jgi:hypothetical protein